MSGGRLGKLYHPVKRPFAEVIRLSLTLAVTPSRPRFVSYLRVSTDGQGRSGLGLEAQRQAVAAHVTQAGGEVLAEFARWKAASVPIGRSSPRRWLPAALAGPCW